jgi:ABC-2 type transport system ATP-binding protein
MEEYAIVLDNISKTFYIRDRSDNSIRAKLKNIIANERNQRPIKALSEINLKIKKGEIIGIIGHNGSGKSTLLKLIMGSILPDKGGSIYRTGKIIRLALGMGFDEELTARDNIYLNASILGVTFKQIGLIFDEIIEFAGLEDFIDTPIKFYSNGMKSRLAFSVGMQAKADILLFDEFFGGVGDEEFMKKSSTAFDQMIESGRTIIIVSHNRTRIEEKCQRFIELRSGKMIKSSIQW